VDPVTKTRMNVSFSFPPGWTQLPVGLSKKLERDKEAEAWADETAQKMLPGADPDTVRERAGQLVHLTMSCRARHDQSGVAFYPKPADGLVAMLDVKTYVPDRKNPVITLELLEDIYAVPTADTIGDIVKTWVRLTSGPAVRIRTTRVEERDPAGHGTVMERVTFAIRPPGFDEAAVASMSWTALQLGDQLAEMADAIARTIQVTRTR
jgi:hypothetical protein